MALDYGQNFVSAQYLEYQYLENELMELDQIFHIHSQSYNMVMALGCCQSFVSSQYLVNHLIEFDQILHNNYMHLH